METSLSRLKSERVTGFKSYYVVWKLYRIVSFAHQLRQFKSYYVVWKLGGEIFNIITIG